jgi:hypothetical protein
MPTSSNSLRVLKCHIGIFFSFANASSISAPVDGINSPLFGPSTYLG